MSITAEQMAARKLCRMLIQDCEQAVYRFSPVMGLWSVEIGRHIAQSFRAGPGAATAAKNRANNINGQLGFPKVTKQAKG